MKILLALALLSLTACATLPAPPTVACSKGTDPKVCDHYKTGMATMIMELSIL